MDNFEKISAYLLEALVTFIVSIFWRHHRRWNRTPWSLCCWL